jgi:hypothetical protein
MCKEREIIDRTIIIIRNPIKIFKLHKQLNVQKSFYRGSAMSCFHSLSEVSDYLNGKGKVWLNQLWKIFKKILSNK